MILRSIAREYVYEFGFPIIPVGLDKKSLIDWKEFQARLPIQEELERWFSEEDINITVITGNISGIVVLDVDG